MYGVPADLDLSRFQGAELIQICLGEFQIQFHFHRNGTISAEGKRELRNASADVKNDGLEAKAPHRHGSAIYQLCVIESCLYQLEWRL
jgi:hypothetical protein